MKRSMCSDKRPDENIQVTRFTFIPFLLAVAGLVILIWLALVLPGAITPAQQNLMDIADWMVKTSIGAILGFSGARLAALTSGQRS